MNWESLPRALREKLIRDNPKILNSVGIIPKAGPMGAVPDPKPKPDALPALDEGPTTRSRREKRLVIVVTFISMRRKVLDNDNLCGSCKALRDAVAKSIGLDDGDKRFRWQYEQFRTEGAGGTLVIIETKTIR